jgi:hypothetical protein
VACLPVETGGAGFSLPGRSWRGSVVKLGIAFLVAIMMGLTFLFGSGWRTVSSWDAFAEEKELLDLRNYQPMSQDRDMGQGSAANTTYWISKEKFSGYSRKEVVAF